MAWTLPVEGCGRGQGCGVAGMKRGWWILAAGLGAPAAAALAMPFAPISSTHRLTDACTWERRPWLTLAAPVLGFGWDEVSLVGLHPLPASSSPWEHAASRACMLRRGVWGAPFAPLKVMARWPDTNS